MNLRARATRSRVAHLPEVVVLVAVDDVVGRHVLAPEPGSLVVAAEIFFRRTFKDRHVEVFGIQMQHVHEILPGIVDGPFLEVVAETPVAQHLEHGVVVGVVPHLLEVVVLAAHAEAFLRIHPAHVFSGVFGAENDIFPLVHTGVGEHQRGVIFDHHRGRCNDFVAFRLKEFLVRLAHFICCHHIRYVVLFNSELVQNTCKDTKKITYEGWEIGDFSYLCK